MSSPAEVRRSTVADLPRGDPAQELDRCLDIVGLGWYNVKYTIVLTLLLVSTVMEIVGMTIILPAAKCDLKISDKQRGMIYSIHYIGIFMTSFIHGYLVDVKGRKAMVIFTSLAAGCTSFLAALMPTLLTFSFCKVLTSLCIAVPNAIPYTFIGEIVPAEYRDTLLILVNSMQLMATLTVSLLAWIIIPWNFRINFGLYTFRSWRLLAMVYAMFYLVNACLLMFGPQSPKFLLSRGNPEAALKVLQTMYAGNKHKQPEDFPVTSLPTPPLQESRGLLESLKEHSVRLFKWKFVRYLALNGSLLFGMCFTLNGINNWAFEVYNRILSNSHGENNLCHIIMRKAQFVFLMCGDRINEFYLGEEDGGICDDSIDITAFQMNAIAQASCFVIGVCVSLKIKYISKKLLLLTCFYLIGTCCLIINHTTWNVLMAILLSPFPLLALVMGPVNAYALEVFPTHLRGLAVCICMMIGRLGSITGSNMTALLINVNCRAMFYFNGVLLFGMKDPYFLLRCTIILSCYWIQGWAHLHFCMSECQSTNITK